MSNLMVDDFNKLVLAIVAIAALFVGPWMQWRISKRQTQIQEEIAKRQAEIQSQIAARQIADNISSKRQAWIDELRADAAEFLTVAGRSQEFRRAFIRNLDPKEAFRGLLDSEMRAKELAIRIRLRLNPNESDHNQLIKLISSLAFKTLDSSRTYTDAEEREIAKSFNDATNEIVRHLQVILKHEWERVKRGDI